MSENFCTKERRVEAHAASSANAVVPTEDLREELQKVPLLRKVGWRRRVGIKFRRYMASRRAHRHRTNNIFIAQFWKLPTWVVELGNDDSGYRLLKDSTRSS